jgi:phosphoenolpyruvate synthase/pyruvate phosphate dikinase
MSTKWVYLFSEGNKDMRDLLGGKGANLAEMTNAGLPVPPGFTITTEACNGYFANEKQFPEGMWDQILDAIKTLEKQTGKRLGDPANPLLISARSGARVSMPGMMDTVLNIGFNQSVLEGFAKLTGNIRVAWDAYRRLVQMFGNIVKEIPRHKFEAILDEYKAKTEGGRDTDLSVDMLKDVVHDFKALYQAELGEKFPDDPLVQIRQAIAAVFNSWFGAPATSYRNAEGLSHDWGTAVNIQTMVFGNMGERSGTGVAFTRNPATGEKKLWGEYLLNAQGEDVVAGIRTPHPISHLKEELPKIWDEFSKICDRLEQHYRDMQDLEFTIERDKLYMLQTRTGKRTAIAAVKIAVDMVQEGLIEKNEALLRVNPNQIDQFLHPHFDPEAVIEAKNSGQLIAQGLNASPGAATGKAIFDADTAAERGQAGDKVILVRPETNPDDVHGMIEAKGILTQRGGMTCVAGESKVLTDQGFLTAEEAFLWLAAGNQLQILAFDHQSRRTIWRKVIAAGQRIADVCTISVSQTGRAKNNILRLTPDHKMFTIKNRKFQKETLEACLENKNFLCVIEHIPALTESLVNESALAYTTGAIFTDGYVNLKPTKGSVTFLQKRTPEKEPFIDAVSSKFSEAFGYSFTYQRNRQSNGILKGRKIEGEVQDLICFHQEPAQILSNTWNNLVPWILTLDKESLYSFLAGVIDGDGTFNKKSNRVNIFVGKEDLLQGIIVACLRLGILPQITNNRNIFNIQIPAEYSPIFEQTNRVFGPEEKRLYSHRLFSIRSLFTDIIDKVNYKGRVKEAIKRNLMFGADKIQRDLLSLCEPHIQLELQQILDSDVRMYRISKVGQTEKTEVYNFEVNATNDLDKNFIVFSSQYTPILVSNSHAAVVARGWGKACVAGCETISIDMNTRAFRVGDTVIHEGDYISIDGTTGSVFKGKISTIDASFEEESELVTLLSWADEIRKLGVWTNADNSKDAMRARNFGAEGIGLCRTEHMFFEEERRPIVVKMIMSDNEAERQKLLDQLLPFQREDFEGIFRAMDGFPVIVRLIDPPMHEFLPTKDELNEEICKLKLKLQRNPTETTSKRLKKKLAEQEHLLDVVESMWEVNPMMGLRGCRAGISYPGLTEMQVRAIFEAACNVAKEGVKVHPEVMIPLVSHVNELILEREKLEKVVKNVLTEKNCNIKYKFGMMIETPRAALTADVVAKYADFFSFGTNDLTQMTYGVSRDDAEGKFLRQYVTRDILPNNPFEILDRDGVGTLMKMTIEKGRTTNSKLEIGGCGEHFGEPSSIEFSHIIGLNYVSASPFRVPIARLAAAQAALNHKYGRNKAN